MEQLYRYCWGNNAVRGKWKNRIVRVISWNVGNTCEIECVKTGKRAFISRDAVRKVKSGLTSAD